ncbi:Hypothetical protein ETEE_2442 [Edwardsiella anguillarum ET080813]|uniref:Uncharacterized protein n=1 Tax=Edwardsiella anguillarum ET080813 TaxID=667120 RepID=A0A076LQN8_9GAMM|nr:Hypothetical protein ETEE_2442 [Edwardsiella anguillarum ET080813]
MIGQTTQLSFPHFSPLSFRFLRNRPLNNGVMRDNAPGDAAAAPWAKSFGWQLIERISVTICWKNKV